ncbi:uncharacterized protein LOC132386095 [Hypanus sabinus]|uniref:uncharacterized protein LOC132386095 n=1 Tax=Hypanus sabinus TaxID=79690 RepID=UPI0028C4695E|nr:uncharacterized protein LOC132386095 [Hypanus sabinus]
MLRSCSRRICWNFCECLKLTSQENGNQYNSAEDESAGFEVNDVCNMTIRKDMPMVPHKWRQREADAKHLHVRDVITSKWNSKTRFGQYSPLAGTAVFQLEGADEHTTTAPSVPTRLDRSGGRVTTASPRASRPGSKRRCNTSPPARRCKGRLFSFLGPFEGLRKRSIRTSAGALTSGERSFWGAEVSIGGVSYDFSSMPAGNEVWFVATGEMDCPLM